MRLNQVCQELKEKNASQLEIPVGSNARNIKIDKPQSARPLRRPSDDKNSRDAQSVEVKKRALQGSESSDYTSSPA